MKPQTVLEALQSGVITIREWRGVTNEEMTAGVSAGRKLIARGEHQAAAEILSGLALYDPYRPDVWLALEELFRRARHPTQAKLFADLARVMAQAA